MGPRVPTPKTKATRPKAAANSSAKRKPSTVKGPEERRQQKTRKSEESSDLSSPASVEDMAPKERPSSDTADDVEGPSRVVKKPSNNRRRIVSRNDDDTPPHAPGAGLADAAKALVAAAGDSSELSDVDDTAPKPKAKRKKALGKAAAKGPATKKKRVSKEAGADLTPDEAELRKLQGQLVKCGVRKIWGVELRKYADDARAKIGHLQGMLRDIGLEGRFSEAKAESIRTRRELMADIEGLTEMNTNLKDTGRRGGRPRARTMRGSAEQIVMERDAKSGFPSAATGRGGGDTTDPDEDAVEEQAAVRGGRSARRQAELDLLRDSDSD